MLEDIKLLPNGANFVLCDLHIHTPESLDYSDKFVTVEAILEECKKKNLKLIAVTDHNTIGNIDEIRESGQEQGITVLPGVEVTVNVGRYGIHVLALFEKDTPKERVTDFLSRIGITSDLRGKDEAISEVTMLEVLDKIKHAGGLGIAAHTDSTKGLTEDVRGQPRKRILESGKLDAMEITKLSTKKYFDGTDSTYGVKIPCIRSSDAHSLEEIGTRAIKLKMDEPSLEGIRQALIDEKSRIRLEEEDIGRHPTIVGIKLDGGFLDGQSIHFNDNLNCLIGGRGVGKSTLVELIRFALNTTPTIEDFESRHFDMVEKLLGSGKIYLLIDVGGNEYYRIERKFNEKAKIYSNQKEVDVDIENFFPIIAYSEREVERVAHEISSQLALIDKFVPDIEPLKSEEQNLITQVENKTQGIQVIEKKISECKKTIAELPTITEKLNTLTKYGFDEKLKLYNMRVKEKEMIDRILGTYGHIQSCYEEIAIEDYVEQLSIPENNEDMINELPNKQLIMQAIRHSERVKKNVLGSLKTIKTYIEKEKEKIGRISSKLVQKHKKQHEKLLTLLTELETNEEKAAQAYMDLKGRQSELEGLKSEVQVHETNLKRLLAVRNRLLRKLQTNRKKLYDKRKATSEELSKKLGEAIEIEIEIGGNTDYYYGLLDESLRGSYINRHEKKSIMENFSPIEFFDILEKKNIDKLNKKTNISKDRCEIILTYPKLREAKYLFQSVQLPDRPVIQLKVGDIYKPVSELSLGQRCTTILSLLMLQTTLPLVIDTPEEGLDNIFIFNSVVQTLRAIKGQRQVLSATHNANIPVSGDAEQIICLESDGRKGWVSCNASIDNPKMKETVQDVLEGGKEAFEIRLRKYGH